jgi:hypothetical protein
MYTQPFVRLIGPRVSALPIGALYLVKCLQRRCPAKTRLFPDTLDLDPVHVEGAASHYLRLWLRPAKPPLRTLRFLAQRNEFGMNRHKPSAFLRSSLG